MSAINSICAAKRAARPALFVSLFIAVLLSLFGVRAAAAAAAPEWQVKVKPGATYFKPGVGGTYSIFVKNVGDSTASGVTVTDTLAPGLSLVRADLLTPPEKGVICSPGPPLRCEYSEPVVPGQEVWVIVQAIAAPSLPEGRLVNEATVEGGGGMTVTAAAENTVSSSPTPGITELSLRTTRTAAVVASPLSHQNWGFENEPAPFTEAGGHPNGQAGGPDSLTFTLEVASQDLRSEAVSGQFIPGPVRDPKDIETDLPSGLLGNPTAVPRPCALTVAEVGKCDASTQVGEATVYYSGGVAFAGPIVEVRPEAGQSAEFVLENIVKANYILTGHVVRTADGYGLTVASNGIPITQLTKVELSFWGVPAAKIHDAERGRFCERFRESAPEAGVLAEEAPWHCGPPPFGYPGNETAGVEPVPFLIMPTDCSVGPERATVKMNSWEEPETNIARSVTMPGVVGCDLLQFEPGISIEPDTLLSDAPVGLGVNLSVQQFTQPEVNSAPELKGAVVTLPVGVSISPGSVDGIQACNAIKAEGEAIEIPTGMNAKGEPLAPGELGPEGEEFGPSGEPQLAPGHCPNASIVGTAEAQTPLLSEPIKGHVYLARPGCGNKARGQAPCIEEDAADGNLYKLYLELGGKGELAKAGVNIKVPLRVEANGATGRLTTVAEGNPQLPFSNLKIELNGGPRAPLDTPATCGPAVTTAEFESWAAPGAVDGVFMPGLPNSNLSSFFNVDLAGDGEATPCPNLPLDPSFVAGMVTANAGKFSTFTMSIARNDREQYVRGIQVHTPPGLLADLASVPLCPENQASNPGVYGECAASKIGTTRVASGAGSHPFEIEGNVYLTGPHNGAPFGLSIVTHAVAGPFDLGLVVVKARIDINPNDSTATITTDESGPYALPQIIFGVPLRLKRISVNIDRPKFMLNPTNCKAQQIVAEVSGNAEAMANVATRFAVGACRSLAFKPTFKVSTDGRASRRTGASLDARLSYPRGAMGKDTNIARVKVSLPKQLPSFLKTLQKACPVQTFEVNPAHCGKASIVGIARTRTPLLHGVLSGPVYFVSHGGEAFPQLVVVLQGDGVRVDLAGSTFIEKGITSTTFKTVPDVPVESFELYLPQGDNHALAANGNLCRERKKLVMPTEFVAQNGAVIKRNTRVVVTDCGSRQGGRTTRAQARTSGSRNRDSAKGRG